MQKLTTTSHVILGLLALRPWSTYELAQQMQRSIGYYWPLLLRWVTWAEQEVADWPDDASQPAEREVATALRTAAAFSS